LPITTENNYEHKNKSVYNNGHALKVYRARDCR